MLSLLTVAVGFSVQISWLNEYHTQCREVVGPELKRQGKKEAYEWLMRETQSIG